MDDTTFNDLTRSLDQAAAHARGETAPGLRVHVLREADVPAIARPERLSKLDSAPSGFNGRRGWTSAPPRSRRRP